MTSLYINRLVNLVTKNGNKHKSEKIVLKSFKQLQKNSIKQPYALLRTAIKQLVPIYRLQTLTNKKRPKKNRKIKKKACLVLSSSYRLTLALKYIMKEIENQKSTRVSDALADEILLTCKGESNSLNKKLDDHTQVNLNRNYIRRYYRWGKIKF
jgi:ribosomal protein S7